VISKQLRAVEYIRDMFHESLEIWAGGWTNK
jgi:hypothetical protein